MKLQRADNETIDDVVRYLRRDQADARRFEPESISLGAAVELAFWNSTGPLHPALVRWQSNHPTLKIMTEIVRGRKIRAPRELYARQQSEFFSVRKKQDVTSDSWNRFLERFSASLRSVGFGKLSHAIAGALDEIGGNITQHSTFGHPTLQMNGIAAYEVEPHRMSFVVGDNGIGALASLHFNPAWRSLATARDAVRAIAQQGASRRIGQGEGQGYQALFLALASLNGSIRLRSRNGVFRMKGALDRYVAQGATIPDIRGLQLCVDCSLK